MTPHELRVGEKICWRSLLRILVAQINIELILYSQLKQCVQKCWNCFPETPGVSPWENQERYICFPGRELRSHFLLSSSELKRILACTLKNKDHIKTLLEMKNIRTLYSIPYTKYYFSVTATSVASKDNRICTLLFYSILPLLPVKVHEMDLSLYLTENSSSYRYWLMLNKRDKCNLINSASFSEFRKNLWGN